MSIQPGNYKGRGVAGTEQWTRSANKHLQLVLDLEVWDPESDASETYRTQTVFTFSDKNAVYEFERLKALGWTGGDFPIRHLPGIDTNEVEIEARLEVFNGKQRMRMQVRTGRKGLVISKEDLLSDDELRRFAAVFKDKVRKPSAPSQAPTTPKTNRNPVSFE